jgi:hypothetical protein
MGQFNPDMGLDWTGLHVPASNNHASKLFYTLVVSSLNNPIFMYIHHSNPKYLHVCCVHAKSKHERDVQFVFILGLLAWMQTVYL